jgi:phosphatidate cytidylyltransferase
MARAGEHDSSPARAPGNALARRVTTASVLLLVLLPAILLLPEAFSIGLIVLFLAAGAWEWSAFFTPGSAPQRLAYAAAVLLLLGLVLWAVPSRLPVMAVVYPALAWWLVAFVWILRFPMPIARPAVALGGFLTLVPAGASLAVLLRADGIGRYLLLLALVIVWAADAGAYFAGRRFGRVKLAPSVSPGKTWEGFLGGMGLAVMASVIGVLALGGKVIVAVSLGLSVAAISVVGDLTVSMFKRSVGLKDSGRLIPGHGGVLDRVDSVTAAAPLFVLEAAWLGWLGGQAQ